MDLMRRRLLMAGNGLKDYTIFGKSEVVGSSVLGVGDVKNWNQLVENGNFADGATGWESMVGTTIEDGVCSFTPTSAYNGPTRKVLVAQQSHKYLYVANLYQSSATSKAYVKGQVGGRNVVIQGTSAGWSQVANIYTEGNSSTIASIGFGSTATSGWSEIKATNFMVFDLTAIFGSGNEPTSVEGFKSWLVSVGKMKSADGEIPYFPYDAGSTFASLPIVAHGRNLWDEEWELGNISTTTGANQTSTSQIRSKNYQLLYGSALYGVVPIAGGRVCFYDEGKNYISYKGVASSMSAITIPSGARYFRFAAYAGYGTTYNHDIIFAESNVDYTPYEEPKVYPLAISAPLHGVGTADFAKFTDKGITRKFGKVSDWTNANGNVSSGSLFYISMPTDAKRPSTSGGRLQGIICNNYSVSTQAATADMQDMSFMRFSNGYFYFKDTRYTTFADFKAALIASGTEIVYELAEETFESVKLPKLPKFKDGTLVYTDTEIHGNITTE